MNHITKLGHSTNASCTSVHLVAELFMVAPKRTCKFSAEWADYVARMYGYHLTASQAGRKRE